jgi:prepilin signal peptidase PulO-like enzyme (type II secretory pathway)
MRRIPERKTHAGFGTIFIGSTMLLITFYSIYRIGSFIISNVISELEISAAYIQNIAFTSVVIAVIMFAVSMLLRYDNMKPIRKPIILQVVKKEFFFQKQRNS